MVGKGLRLAGEAGDNNFNQQMHPTSSSGFGRMALVGGKFHQRAPQSPPPPSVGAGKVSINDINSDHSYILIPDDTQHPEFLEGSMVLDMTNSFHHHSGTRSNAPLPSAAGGGEFLPSSSSSCVVDGFSPIVIPASRCSSTHRHRSVSSTSSHRRGAGGDFPQHHSSLSTTTPPPLRAENINSMAEVSYVVGDDNGSSPILLLHTPAVPLRQATAFVHHHQQPSLAPPSTAPPGVARSILAEQPQPPLQPHLSAGASPYLFSSPEASFVIATSDSAVSKRNIHTAVPFAGHEDGASPIMIFENRIDALPVAGHYLPLPTPKPVVEEAPRVPQFDEDDAVPHHALEHRSFSQLSSVARSGSEMPHSAPRPALQLRASSSSSAVALSLSPPPRAVAPPTWPTPQSMTPSRKAVGREMKNTPEPDVSFYFSRHAMDDDEVADTSVAIVTAHDTKPALVTPPNTTSPPPAKAQLQNSEVEFYPHHLAESVAEVVNSAQPITTAAPSTTLPPFAPITTSSTTITKTTTTTAQAIEELESLQRQRKQNAKMSYSSNPQSPSKGSTSECDDGDSRVMCESYVFSRLDEVASSGAATPVARRGGMMGAAVKTDVELVAPSPMMFADNQPSALLDMAATHDDNDDDDDEEEDTSLCASASYRRLRSITLSLGGDTPMLRSGNGGQRLLDYEISNDDDDDDVEKSDSAEVAVVDNNSNNSAVTATRHHHTAHTQNEDEEATNSNHVALAEDDDGVALTSGRTLGGLRAAAERHETVAPAAAAAAVVAPSLEALRFVAAFRESVDKSRSSIMARLSTSSNTSTLSALSFAGAGDRHSVLLIPEPSQDALDSVNVNHSDWTDDHLSKNEESVVQFGAPTPISASSSINLSWMMLPEGGAAEGGDDDRSVLKREREVADEEEDERADEEDTDLASSGPSSRRGSVSPRSQNHRQPRPRAVPADQRRLEGQTKGVTPFSRQRAVPPPTPPLPRSNPVGSAAAVHRNTTADASSLHAPSPPPLLAPPPRATLTTRASSIMQGQLSDTPKLRLSKDAVEKLLSIFTQEGEGGRVWQRLRAAVKQHASTETGPHTSTSSSSSSSAAAADKDLKIELRILAQVLLSFVRVANGSSTFAKQRMSAGDVFRGLVALYVERMQKCRSLTTNCTSNGSRTRSSLPNSLQSSRAPSPSISSQAPPLSQRSDDDDAAVMTGTGTVRDLICAAVGGSSLLAAPSPFVVFVERRAPAPYTHHHHHDESDTTSTPPAGGTAGGGTGNSSVAATLKHLSKKLTAARGTTTTSLARPSTAFGSSSTRTAFASSSVSSSSALSSTWTTVPVHFAEYDFHSKSLCDVGKFWEALRKLRRAELMLNAASSGPVLGQ